MTSISFFRLHVCLFLVALLPAAGMCSAASSAANTAGRVDLIAGEVSIFDHSRSLRRIHLGDALYEGDRVVTGRDGELHVAMEDGGYLAVRPNTELNIVAYQARGRDDDRSLLSLVTGSLRSITGWIGQHNPKSYQVRTPTATIGVRGTDHEPLVIPEGATEGEPGTYDKVNAGRTVLESTRGRASIEVTPNRAGFAPLRGTPAPRLLAAIPRFYRPGRNERRLDSKARATRDTLERLREERRRATQPQRSELQRDRRDARAVKASRFERHDQGGGEHGAGRSDRVSPKAGSDGAARRTDPRGAHPRESRDGDESSHRLRPAEERREHGEQRRKGRD